MSSFVISKQEYVKVAGVVGGIIKARNRFSDPGVWLFDYDAGKNMEPDGYLRRFIECYKLNAESVAAQYHDDACESDPCDYKATYDQAFELGQKIAFDASKLRKLAHELDFFSRSVSYQIEDREANMIVDQWFSKIILLLFRLTDNVSDRNSWGRFDLESAVA